MFKHRSIKPARKSQLTQWMQKVLVAFCNFVSFCVISCRAGVPLHITEQLIWNIWNHPLAPKIQWHGQHGHPLSIICAEAGDDYGLDFLMPFFGEGSVFKTPSWIYTLWFLRDNLQVGYSQTHLTNTSPANQGIVAAHFPPQHQWLRSGSDPLLTASQQRQNLCPVAQNWWSGKRMKMQCIVSRHWKKSRALLLSVSFGPILLGMRIMDALALTLGISSVRSHAKWSGNGSAKWEDHRGCTRLSGIWVLKQIEKNHLAYSKKSVREEMFEWQPIICNALSALHSYSQRTSMGWLQKQMWTV